MKHAVPPKTFLRKEEPLASKTTFRVGGNARYFAQATNEDELSALLKWVRAEQLPFFLLGRGSNVLVAEEGFDGLVIRLHHPAWKQIRFQGHGKFFAGGGVWLKELCNFACNKGYGGLEFLEGIPGSVGGAIRMNAGAMGGQMAEIVDKIYVMNYKGTAFSIRAGELKMEYRTCPQLTNVVITGVVLKGYQMESEIVRKKMQEFAERRKSLQPRQSSAGCFFKNPQGASVGQIVEELGLKGWSCGGAAVSEVHGNFIVNKGGATSEEVLAVAKHVWSVVKFEKGISLEPEVILLGKEWKEILQ